MPFTIDDLNEKIIKNLKFNAIRSLDPNAQFNITAQGTVVFHSSQSFTQQEIQDEMDRLQKLWDDNEYARKRILEYPPITDYIDGVVKGNDKQIQDYIDACQAIKNKYPKP